jgi:hypothetical protein
MMFQVHFRNEVGHFSYVLASRDGDEALVIDPVEDRLEVYAELMDRLGYRLRYTLETGSVPESAKAAMRLCDQLGGSRVVPCDADPQGAAIRVGHGEVLRLAGLDVEAIGRIARPNQAISYYVGESVFVGACDLRREAELLSLPGDTLVYRSQEVRGTHFSLLALEAGATLLERACWRAGEREDAGAASRPRLSSPPAPHLGAARRLFA